MNGIAIPISHIFLLYIIVVAHARQRQRGSCLGQNGTLYPLSLSLSLALSLSLSLSLQPSSSDGALNVFLLDRRPLFRIVIFNLFANHFGQSGSEKTKRGEAGKKNWFNVTGVVFIFTS